MKSLLESAIEDDIGVEVVCFWKFGEILEMLGDELQSMQSLFNANSNANDENRLEPQEKRRRVQFENLNVPENKLVLKVIIRCVRAQFASTSARQFLLSTNAERLRTLRQQLGIALVNTGQLRFRQYLYKNFI